MKTQAAIFPLLEHAGKSFVHSVLFHWLWSGLQILFALLIIFWGLAYMICLAFAGLIFRRLFPHADDSAFRFDFPH
jgi:hypothetical protein